MRGFESRGLRRRDAGILTRAGQHEFESPLS